MASLSPAHDGPAVPAGRVSPRIPYLVAILVFVGSAGATLYFNYSMSGAMPMPGNWTMSMMWMPMGSLPVSAAIFTLMWLAMMVAMMLPSALPMLLLYRRAVAFRGEVHPGRAMFSVATGYFLVWTLFGIVAYAIGVVITRSAMHSPSFSRALPCAGGLALSIAGFYQITPWKSACLKHCRDPLALVATHLSPVRFGAFRMGIHHGAVCAACCWALMLIQLVLGVMNLTVMVVVAFVIALEKLLPGGVWFARVVGVATIVAGIVTAVLSIRAL